MAQKTITITIDVPEGCGVKFNKGTNQIEFIKKDSRPKSWEEYCKQIKNTACYIAVRNAVMPYIRVAIPQYNEFSTEEEAKAFTALGKLIQLHKAWIGDWKPNWQEDSFKFVIEGHASAIAISTNMYVHRLLAFPTEELRDEFLDTFKDLLEEAKPFI
jgi:hypothetical protein